MKNSEHYFFLFAISVTKAFSCTCPPQRPVKDEFMKTDLIVSGKVINEEIVTIMDSVALAKHLQNGGTTDERMQQRMFGKYYIKHEFIVSEAFKGELETDTISIYTPGNSCRSNFEIGKDYIIYGYDHEASGIPAETSTSSAYPNGKNLVWTQYCSRTKLFKKQEANQLRRLAFKYKKSITKDKKT